VIIEKEAYTLTHHKRILKQQGVEFFENWKPTPKYTADGTDNNDKKKEGEEKEEEEKEKEKRDSKKLGSTLPLQRNFSLPQLQDPK
jgi:hypothetical protein